MNIKQIILNAMFNLLIMHFEIQTTTAAAILDRKTRSQLLNEQNKYKHVLYTLLHQNYVDAAENDDDIVNDYNKLNEQDDDRQIIRMEYYNEIVDYLKVKIKEINNALLDLDGNDWDTKNENIIKVYKQRLGMKNMNSKGKEKKDLVSNVNALLGNADHNQNIGGKTQTINELKNKKILRFKRSPLERRPIMFHDKIFNFNKNISIEMDDNERKFATGVYLRGKKPEGENAKLAEELAKWQAAQAETNESASHEILLTSPSTPGERHRRFLTSTTTTEPTRQTLPDFVDNFGNMESKESITKGDVFDNLIGFKDGRDPEKYTVRMGKFNPHPSAEYFVDKVENWVSWAGMEVSRLSATSTKRPLSTLDYYYSKASMSRFFSLNPRYLQSTDADGLNKWGGRQFLPRSREDFTFDLNDLENVTQRSEELRSFYTWREAVDWSRQPSNRPSTHPWFSIEVDKILKKRFKCVSCNKYETKELPRYIDHLYEHFLRNSLMIPSFEEVLTELRRREALTGSETWRREF